jgi:hypothetical protein
MSRTKNSLLLYSVTIPLAYCLLKHLHHVMLPFNTSQKIICQNPVELAATYSAPGLSDALDRLVCVLIRFCSEAINNPLCFPLTVSLIGLATTAYAVMSIERARFQSSKTIAPFMITMGNVIGTGIVSPFAWIPWYGWTLRKHQQQSQQIIKKTDSDSHVIREQVLTNSALPHVTPSEALGTAMATLFGQFLPVALLVSHKPSMIQRNLLATFQYFPLACGLFEYVVPPMVRSFGWKTKRGGEDSVRYLYAGVASINAFIWLWLWILWLQTTDSPVAMIKEWIGLFFSFGSLQKNLVTYMIMWDNVALFGTFAYWSWLEDGLEGLGVFFKYSIMFGPGAGLAIYGLKRESRIFENKV